MDKEKQYGHDTEDPNKPRTEDVLIFENVDFASMLLPQHIVEGLYSANFRRPSPIQLKAVPLARCGFDLIVQAKSGTGKTLVFGITALDVVKTDVDAIQALIIAPTREIALQIKDVITVIGSNIEGLKVKAFIGGLDMKKDRKEAAHCHIAVVTPGRAKQLIDTKVLCIDSLRLLVLDEADKLMEPCFTKDINRILKFATGSKQIILASATLCNSVSAFIEKYMNEPMRVTATGVKLLTDSENDVPRVLLGVKQFIGEVQAPANIAQQLRKKADSLMEILKGIPFNQCIVFSNYQTRAESICNMLTGGGWPAVSICGKQEQFQRMAAVAAFKEFRCRVLLSTDLTARGLDVHGVSLVVNLDVPYNAATYLHRMGRAGRFGSSGIVISLVATNEETTKFRNILYEIGGVTMAVHKLPTNLATIHDTDSLDTIVALPPEDVNANVEHPEPPKPAGDPAKPANGLDGLCAALLETYLEPKPALELRSYEELENSRQSWTPQASSRAVPAKNMTYASTLMSAESEDPSKKDVMTYAAKLAKTYEEQKFDQAIVKTVLEKNWSDDSRVSSELEASSESEPSGSETESDSSGLSIPLPEVKVKKPCRKTVTVNLPERSRRSSGSSGCARARKNLPGRCCNHVCENAQWNGGSYFDASAQWNGTGDNRYYDANAQWYSNWESQMNHIRFYVEYMEYWRNSYMNMYGKPSEDR